MEASSLPLGSLKYRSDVDGLRAVAVVVVILFHYGLPAASGGFVGVDIFFVISGYLITGLLISQIDTVGLSLPAFYQRRVRRILPALVMIIAVVLAAGWFLLLPYDYEELGRSAAYSAAGLGNLYFFHHTGYFDREAGMRPLLHLWSLGVEEQFYAGWPILLAMLAWITGKRRKWLGAAVAILTVIAFSESVRVVLGNPRAGFYLPQSRAWELALGALLVFLPALPTRIGAELAGIAGLGMIACAVLVLTPLDPFPGVNSLLPCLGAALIIWPRKDRSFVSGLLGVFPLRRTGEISYSLYLWHWPLLVYLRYYENGAYPSVAETVAVGLIAFVLAYLSWRYVEIPFRNLKAPPFRTIAAGVTAVLLVLALSTAIVHSGGFPNRVPAQTLATQGLDQMWEWSCPYRARLPELNGVGEPDCVFGAPWDNATMRAMLWGDSHAEHMAPLVEAAAQGLSESFLLYTPCSAALGGNVNRDIAPPTPDYKELCADRRARGLQLLKDHPEIKLVILASAWRGVADKLSPPSGPAGGPGSIALVRRGIEEFLNDAAEPGRRFILIAEVPRMRLDPVSCDVAERSGLLRSPCPDQGALTRGEFDRWHGPANEALIAIAAERTDTSTILPGSALCDARICHIYVDGLMVYRDKAHLRRNLSEQVKRRLADLFGLTAGLSQAN